MEEPLYLLLRSAVILAIGVLFFRFREEIGGATGYYARFHLVTKPTPGCMLIPFAVIIMLGGAIGIVVSIIELVK